jgi:hypothetical protein
VLPQLFKPEIIISKYLINGKDQAAIQAHMERASTMIRSEAHHQ